MAQMRMKIMLVQEAYSTYSTYEPPMPSHMAQMRMKIYQDADIACPITPN
jgi:hypothetical protein